MGEKDNFDKAKDVAQIVSLIAIPIVLAVGGWLIQKSMKDQEIKRDYLKIAVEILSRNTPNQKLNEWAIRTFNNESPVELDRTAAREFTVLHLDLPEMPPEIAAPCKPFLSAYTADSILAMSHEEIWLRFVDLLAAANECSINQHTSVQMYEKVREMLSQSSQPSKS